MSNDYAHEMCPNCGKRMSPTKDECFVCRKCFFRCHESYLHGYWDAKKESSFVVHKDDYMGSGVEMCIKKGTSLKEILNKEFDWSLEEGEKLSEEKLIEECDNINGDGMPYITILDLVTGKKVFG